VVHRPALLAVLAVSLLLVACEGAGAAKPPQPSFAIPYALEHGPGSTLFLTDARNGAPSRILRYDLARRRTTVYARGFAEPAALARHRDGSLYVGDVRQGVVRVDARGRRTVVARIPAAAALALDGDTLYVSSLESTIESVDLRTRAVTRVAGDGRPESSGDGGPARAASVESPHGLALDAGRSLYLEAGGSVRRIDRATGIISTFAQVDAGRMAFGRDGTLYFSQGDPRLGGAIRSRAPDGAITTYVSGPNLLPTDVLLTRDGRGLLFGQTRPFPAIRRIDLATKRITLVLRGRG
jgi:sugar lactone lactonase YvrE